MRREHTLGIVPHRIYKTSHKELRFVCAVGNNQVCSVNLQSEQCAGCLHKLATEMPTALLGSVRQTQGTQKGCKHPARIYQWAKREESRAPLWHLYFLSTWYLKRLAL